MSAQVTLLLVLAVSASLALPAPIEGRASFRSGPSLRQNPSSRQQQPSYYQNNNAYQRNNAYQQNNAYQDDSSKQRDSSYEQTQEYSRSNSNYQNRANTQRPRPTFQNVQPQRSTFQPTQSFQSRPPFQPSQSFQSRPTFRPRTSVQPRYPDTIPNYNYDYGVQDQFTGASYGANEDRNGDSTRGSYFVDLPDGRRQMVNYRVDGDSGFVAEVTYEGEAIYPAQTPTSSNSFRPAYQPTRFAA